jgi:hypothetical protein
MAWSLIFQQFASQFASFFTTETNLSSTELEDLKNNRRWTSKKENDRLHNQIDFAVRTIIVYHILL